MEGALECGGSVDERGMEIIDMFTRRPRPNASSTYCGMDSHSDTSNNSTTLELDNYATRLANINTGDERPLTSSTTSRNTFQSREESDVLTRSSFGLSEDYGGSSRKHQSRTKTSSSDDPRDPERDLLLEKEGLSLIGQLNDKLLLGQSLDAKTTEQVNLVTKAISKLNGCGPKYPPSASLVGEMPNLCLSKHRCCDFLEIGTSSAKCSSSDCANPKPFPAASCCPEQTTTANGVNGFLNCCQSHHPPHPQYCQSSREVDADGGPQAFVSYVSERVFNEARRKTFQSQNTLDTVTYVGYESETQMPDIMRLIQKDLSEPYSVYTYRYFIHNWPHLCYLALIEEACVGAIVCKLDMHKKNIRRGYIAMLAVDKNYRKKRIGSNLVLKAIQAMIADDADEVVLETEITNKSALQLYENLGFVRDKRLFRYYLNGVDALRLKLWLR